MWIRQKWLLWILAQFLFHITENSHEVSSMVEIAKFSLSFYNRSSADAPWLTFVSSLNPKNLRRIKVPLVWCLGKDWAHKVTARGREPCETPSHGSPWGWTALGPSHQPSKGLDRLGGSQGTPSPTARCVYGDTPGLGSSWKVCKSRSTPGQGWDKAGDRVTYNSYGDSPEGWAEMGSTLMLFILQRTLHKTRQLDNNKAVYFPSILEVKVFKRMKWFYSLEPLLSKHVMPRWFLLLCLCMNATQHEWKCHFYDIPCRSVTNHSADLDSMQILKNFGCSY